MKKRNILIIILSFLLMIWILLGVYFFMTAPTSNKSKEITIKIDSGETYNTIAKTLKDEDLIKSEWFFKLYIKLNNANHLEAGTYKLNKNMGVRKIVKAIDKGSTYNPDAIILTIPEGRRISQIADYVSEITGKEAEEYLTYWDSVDFINTAIEKYWFITEEVKNTNLKHALEGYFFPETYELDNKDVSAEYIAYKLLDQMEIVLNKYKEEIEQSSYSVHEILTLSSIVEYEAKLDEDRPIVAGVFYNRLNDGWELESCATACYAAGTDSCMPNDVPLDYDSPYNTYMYLGLPIGPGNSPGEKSIEATLYPTNTEYYFFISDICYDGYGEDDKMYFSKTDEEHESFKDKYLTCR